MFELPGDSDLVCNVVLRLASGLQVGKGMRQVDGTGPGSEETRRAPRKDRAPETPPPARPAHRSTQPDTPHTHLLLQLLYPWPQSPAPRQAQTHDSPIERGKRCQTFDNF